MQIRSLYIDGLHNAVNKTYTFGDISYIFGNNGIGKSTILQAIQFGLLGYIPGTAKNSKEAILRHSPKGEIVVRMTLIDGSNEITLERKTNQGGNRFVVVPESAQLDDIIAALEVPIFNFNEFVGQTANKLKEYFIKNILPVTNGELDWSKILSEAIADNNFTDKDAILEYGMSLISDLEGDTLAQVVQANTKFKADQTFKKSELQRLQNTIDSLIYYDDYMGPTDINALNSQIIQLGSLRDQLIKYETAVNTTKHLQEELAQLNSHIEALGGNDAYDKYTADISKIHAAQDSKTQQINSYRTQLAELSTKNETIAAVIAGNGICPYTKESCPTMSDKISSLSQTREQIKQQMSEIENNILHLSDDMTKYRELLHKYQTVISDFTFTWGKIESIKPSLANIPEKPDTDKTVFDLDQNIAKLTQDKEKLQANIKYNETIENITELKYEAELQSAALAKWVKITDTNGLQTTLMQAPFEELAATMTRYIQQMYGNAELKAHFNISSKANSFSFGMIRDNIYIPYDLLSSGEKCLYALALMICIVNNGNSPLKLLLLDDAFDHLDARAIEATFTTLKNIQGIQFIFAGVKDCEAAKDIMVQV